MDCVELSQDHNTNALLTKQNGQSRKVLSVFQSHFKSQQNTFTKKNPEGYVNFGVSINLPNMQRITRYFPTYMNVSNFQYTMANLEKNFNEVLSKGSPYNSNETFGKNNLATVVTMHADIWQKISVQGEYSEISAVQSYSNCQIVPKNESKCHIVFFPKADVIQKYIGSNSQQRILLVVQDLKDVIKTDKRNIFYALQITYQDHYNCGICFYKDSSLQKQFEFHFSNLQLSTFVSSTIQRIHKGLCASQSDQLKKISEQTNCLKTFTQMIKQSPQTIVDQENVFVTIGAGSALTNLGHSIFTKGDRMLLDKPYYFAFIPDFKKSEVQFEFSNLFQGTLKQKAEKALSRGLKGYLVVNPHNPSGKVYAKNQIQQVCQWAKIHPQFHMIFDQMYRNSIFDKQIQSLSAVNYSNKLQNVHVIRGFAKDFSLCGIKVGMLISCNKVVKEKFTLWKKIISPQQIVIKAVAKMVRQTEYGRVVFKEVKSILEETNKLAFELLEKHRIPFIRPQGGCFLLIDLRSYLKKSGLSEQQVWVKLFYDHKVNITMGRYLGFEDEGYFRVCHVVDEQSIVEGFGRIGAFCREFDEKNNL